MNKVLKLSFGLLAISTCALAQFPGINLPKVKQPAFKTDTFNIKQFDAKGDGLTLNTNSINDAITSCSEKGGGVVLVPGGVWLTGPIDLKSNVNLHIDRDGILLFTKDFNQYPIVEGSYEGLPAGRCKSPISGKDLQNIAITGTGIIDGNGDAWRMVKKDKLTATQWQDKIASGGLLSADKKTWYPTEKSLKGSQAKDPGILKEGRSIQDFEVYKDFLRPNMVVLNNCKRILLEGVTFQNSPAWNLHPFLCSDLTLRGVNVKNPWYAQNGDGIDLESSTNTLIENSTFDVGDDGICIKSGRDEAGRKLGKPTENVIVRNCVVYHAHGGFVIGSEMSGGAKNIFVYNCSFLGTDVGLRFKTTRGRGGVVQNIYVTNINMKDIGAEAILFDMYYMAKDPVALSGEKRDAPKVEVLPVTEATPQFKDFHISNIVCNGAATALFIRGLPEMNILGLYLNDMVIKAKKGMVCTEATGVYIKNFRMITDDTNPVVSIDNSQSIYLDHIAYKPGSDLLFKISGSKTSDIAVTNTPASAAKSKLLLTDGATQKSIHIK
ncbi:glycoside hydrolase family 28 protein [Mucilaginibacter paludis]|uniref:Glycoside hydrolase family 28 n=1 Tax=Mucilaginibacter paludis DSM 18603 TaxID=714943 RepID=H1XZR9_9SPHI|nr:glycoside hydrolase family 28 protein [Mucilaginibacter paludis]EHQ27761.1 glycoside hydrolase family 28 [Mucilaginibacter paludis DSM 18603]